MTDPQMRAALEAKGVFLHPQALVESEEIGEGTRIWAFAHVLKGARIGKGCNLCDGVYVEWDAELGDNVTVKNHVSIWEKVRIGNNVFLGPSCVLTNDVNPRAAVKKGPGGLIETNIEDGVSIGANATILCGITLHRHSFIAAGAVVNRNVPAYGLMAGVPARRIGWMCVCGRRVHAGRTCECGHLRVEKSETGEETAVPLG
jgi:acetyltransferase-like isoleucine patch superfamily enzyme